MKAFTVKEIKIELNNLTHKELIDFCLSLSKFKKENKELLSYLLFHKDDEENYINNIKLEVDELFELINTNSYFYIKKSVRKILRRIKTYSRYSKKKETDVELRLYFCSKLSKFKPSINNNQTLKNIYLRELASIKKTILLLHEDLQYDYNQEIENLSL